MQEAQVIAPQDSSPQSIATQARIEHCDDCLGSGGWYRYEPAMEPAPGLLYLSCLRCRGSGRLALARA